MFLMRLFTSKVYIWIYYGSMLTHIHVPLKFVQLFNQLYFILLFLMEIDRVQYSCTKVLQVCLRLTFSSAMNDIRYLK